MRATTALAVLTLVACGDLPVTVLDASVHSTSALENGARADAILGQLSERGRSAARTDAGSFGTVAGVAVGLTSDKVYIADGGNNRVLGYSSAAALASGASADIVINQQDFTTTDFRNIPTAQQLTPTGVAVDPEGRLYVYSTTNVLVFEDPSTDDKAVDYELVGEPAAIQSVRALDNNKLAVVGNNGIEFYERGSPDPYAQASLAAPCANEVYDIAEDGGIYFVACGGGLLCSGGVGTCSGVAVTKINSITGFAEIDDVAGVALSYVAYTDLVGARSLDINSNRLLVADTAGHRILRFDNPASQALSVIPPGTGLPQTPTNALTTYGQPDGVTPPVSNYHNSGTPQVSDQGLSLPTFLAIAPVDRRMWVADSNNNRVVVYTDIAGTNPGRTAQLVLGQPDDNHAFGNRVEADSFAQIAGVALGANLAAVADTATNRVLLYDDIAGSAPSPSAALGQADLIDYELNRGSITPPVANGLSGPTHVAIGPTNSWVWVTDAGNNRVLAFETPSTGVSASRVFGAINLTSGGVYGGFGAIAVSSDHVFVAAGNRVFMYAITAPGQKPTRVFGQEQPPPGVPLSDDIGNQPNRGSASPRADSLSNVTGLAIDSAGRLWVADRGNNRVLWFDDPSSTTGDLTEIVTADGVVGQPDFSSGTARMGTSTVNRYSFAGVSDIAITGDGTLWVSDSVDSRVLAFFTPMDIDPTLGVARADRVLGQDRFTGSGANNAANGINGATMNGPFSVAADPSGRTLLVSDRGNNRALRFIDSRPPVATGDGVHEVVRGTPSTTVTVTVTDPENDSIGIAPVPPFVSAISGAPPLSVPVELVWASLPEEPPVGSDIVVNVVATDRGPRAQQTTFSVIFRIVDRATEPDTGTPEAPRPALDPDDGCVCSTGATAVPWIAALLAWRRRRRRG